MRIAVALAAICALAGALSSLAKKSNIQQTPWSAKEATEVLHLANPQSNQPAGGLVFDAPSLDVYYTNRSLPIVLANRTDNPLPPLGTKDPLWGKLVVCVQLVSAMMTREDHHLVGVFDLDHVVNQAEGLTADSARIISWKPPASWPQLTPDSRFFFRADVSFEGFGAACRASNKRFYSSFFQLRHPQWDVEGLDWRAY